MVNHQGRIVVGGELFGGVGQFKFAFVDGEGTQTFWRNAPDLDANGEPDVAAPVAVVRGHYAVALGDPAIPNMAALPAGLFHRTEVYLRVWFDDGSHGFERLVPDQRYTPVGAALVAAEVPDGSITPVKLAPGTLGGIEAQIALLTAQLHALSNRHESLVGAVVAGVPPGVPVVSRSAADATLTAQGFAPILSVPSPAWVDGTAAGAPTARYGHSGIWTGSEMIVWGGSLTPVLLSGAGAAYQVASDTWRTLPALGAPEARTGHTAAWSGTEMWIWGGYAAGNYLNTGGRYSPAAQSWTPLPTADAPPGREGHIMVWTGLRLLVWGGRNHSGLLDSGAAYDPEPAEWNLFAVSGTPVARSGASAVWTGAEVMIWGGTGSEGPLNSGGRLAFTPDGNPLAWATIAGGSNLSARSGHTAVWTGHRMIIWGGRSGSVLTGDGSRYDPVTDTWEPVASAGAPSPRHLHGALWTGSEMIIHGGETAAGPAADGAAYDPVKDTWRPLNSAGHPQARSEGVSIWTGTELVVFGGRAAGQAVAALERLVPQPDWHFYLKP